MQIKFRGKYRIQSTRLKHWNYSNPGLYFITICTKSKVNYFGSIEDSLMNLSLIGKLVQNFWLEIPKHFKNVYLDEFIIMPNHIHGIIGIEESSYQSSRRDVAMLRLYDVNTEFNSKFMSNISPKKNSIPTVICSFKSISTKTINLKYPRLYFSWQPRYYDHIIRNESSLEKIQNYIVTNPKNWEKDKFYC